MREKEWERRNEREGKSLSVFSVGVERKTQRQDEAVITVVVTLVVTLFAVGLSLLVF